ncbi:MAG TPA: hypothetical protein VGL61_05430 [Kofleriaceae bacterium]|jgi:hypothetical protein
MRALITASLAVLGGCAPSYTLHPIYQTASGQYVAQRCELDGEGDITDRCDDIVITGSRVLPTAEELAPPAPVAPPDAAAIARAITDSGAARLVGLCRASYASSVAALDVGMAIAPSGEITKLELHDADGPFADCAAKALRTTTITPFDGSPIHVDEHVAMAGG